MFAGSHRNRPKMSDFYISTGRWAFMGTMMNTEFGAQSGESQEQQQQGDRPDLTRRYRAIGIPAVSAAALSSPKKRVQPPQQQATNFQYED